MAFTTPQTISITASAADANRVEAVATGLGYASIKAMIIALVKQQVSSYEQQQNQTTFDSTYTPVAPS